MDLRHAGASLADASVPVSDETFGIECGVLLFLRGLSFSLGGLSFLRPTLLRILAILATSRLAGGTLRVDVLLDEGEGYADHLRGVVADKGAILGIEKDGTHKDAELKVGELADRLVMGDVERKSIV